jgi:hypothetical protein
MAAHPIAQKARGQRDGRFITFNSSESHLPKPAAEFHIAHFFAKLGANAGPWFSPSGGAKRGRDMA